MYCGIKSDFILFLVAKYNLPRLLQPKHMSLRSIYVELFCSEGVAGWTIDVNLLRIVGTFYFILCAFNVFLLFSPLPFTPSPSRPFPSVAVFSPPFQMGHCKSKGT